MNTELWQFVILLLLLLLLLILQLLVVLQWVAPEARLFVMWFHLPLAL